MKKISIAFFAGVLFFAACGGNPNSPTEGDWSKEESIENTEHNGGHGAATHGGTEEKTSDTTMVDEMGSAQHH